MTRRRFFPTTNHALPIPPSEPFTFFDVTGIAHGRTAARQATIEPATGGVDRAMSWSGWFIAHNIGNQTHRLWSCSSSVDGTQQYSCNIINADHATLASLFQFALFNTGQTANIQVRSTNKILRSHLYHYTVTYSGNSSHTGYKLYLNGVEDTTATKVMSGAYTTAGQNAAWRYQLCHNAAATTNGGFRGRQKNHTVWNRVLTASEVTDLVNLGAGDVTTLPWYAAAVVAHWPLATDTVCVNNAAFNFGSLVGIGWDTYPFGFNYKFVSVFHAQPGNARYVAFGSMYKKWNGKFACYTRSGTDHTTSGKIVSFEFNHDNYTASGPVDVITSVDDMREAVAAPVDGNKIVLFSNRYTTPAGPIISAEYYESTDGLIGATFGSAVSYASILPVGFGFGLTYPKLVPGYVAGEYVVPWYSGDVGGTSKIGLLKRSALGVWSYVPVYSGATAYGEPCILRAEDNTYVMIMRLVGGTKLHMTYSTDGGTTWSAPANTNIGTGECMADICMMPNTRNIVLCYCDRTTERCSISTGNRLADIIADPTDWNAKSDIFQAYAFGNILGYPSIVPDGYNIAGCVSAEQSSAIADLYFFYGQADFL
jgi:hypothetical protein